MEELEIAVARLIEQATTGVDASVGFLQAELPDVIHQLLMWHVAKSAIMTSFGVVFLVALIALDIFAFKVAKKKEEECTTPLGRGDAWMLYFILGSIPRVFYFVAIAFINLTWLQIWIAPKVWLLEYAADLVK